MEHNKDAYGDRERDRAVHAAIAAAEAEVETGFRLRCRHPLEELSACHIDRDKEFGRSRRSSAMLGGQVMSPPADVRGGKHQIHADRPRMAAFRNPAPTRDRAEKYL